jgi:hypothetical protein
MRIETRGLQDLAGVSAEPSQDLFDSKKAAHFDRRRRRRFSNIATHIEMARRGINRASTLPSLGNTNGLPFVRKSQPRLGWNLPSTEVDFSREVAHCML